MTHTLVTDFVPSEIACFASSPGRIRRTAVWISRDEIVDFFEYAANSNLNQQHKVPRCSMEHTRGLSSNAFEDVVDKRIQNCHSLV